MLKLARTATGHPRIAVLAWVIAVIAFGAAGLQFEERVTPSILVVPGTQADEANQIAVEQFGESTLVPVVFTGPAADLDRQGPSIVSALRERSDSRVLSPWDRSEGVEQFRPRPGEAVVIVAVDRPEKQVVETAYPEIQRTVADLTFAPVKTRVTGQAAINSELKDVALEQTRQLELIALGAIFVLMIVLTRSPLAALVTTAFGATAIPVAHGITALTAEVVETDALAAAFTSMLGLALGIGFSMLVVGRFRQELAKGTKPRAAAIVAGAAVGGPGRTVLMAATAVAVGMIVADLLSPTLILTSVGIGATTVTITAGLAAVAVLPSLLAWVGPRIEMLSFGRPVAALHRPRLMSRVVGHPVTIAVVTLAALLALAAPALDAETGPPDANQLPADNQARKDFEAFTAVLGPGWGSPYEIFVASTKGPITTEKTLARIERFQSTLLRDGDVLSVVGPGDVHASAEELQELPKMLKSTPKTIRRNAKNLDKLIAGLKLATDGVHQIKSGIAEAAGGSGQLSSGSGQAADGAGRLRAGLEAAQAGSARLYQGLQQADAGAAQLAGGSGEALAGARLIAGGLGEAEEGVSTGLPALKKIVAAVNANKTELDRLSGLAATAKTELDSALAALGNMQVEPGSPGYDQYQAALAALTQAAAHGGDLAGGFPALQTSLGQSATAVAMFEEQVGTLAVGLKKLHAGANELVSGLGQLATGNAALADGIGQLSAGSGELNAGLGQLAAGARALEAGLDKIAGGTAQLTAGLSGADKPAGKLYAGMQEITSAVVKSRKNLPRSGPIYGLFAESPHLFDSGYFVLAALEGAPTERTEQATFAVNVYGGGLAGRITVVPREAIGTPGAEAVGDRLETASAAFAKRTGLVTAVGGPGAQLAQYQSEIDHVPLVLVALSVIALVVLVAALRALALPLVAVLLNLLTAAAVFGALTRLFGPGDPLGGPDWIDPISVIGTLCIVLGLSVSYQLFELAPAREAWRRSGDARAAVAAMRSRTLTTVAVVMVTAFAVFAAIDVAAIRQFAVGAALAVLIDMTLVRMLLLPAAMRLLGRRAWWPLRPAVAAVPSLESARAHAVHGGRRRPGTSRRVRREKERS